MKYDHNCIIYWYLCAWFISFYKQITNIPNPELAIFQIAGLLQDVNLFLLNLRPVNPFIVSMAVSHKNNFEVLLEKHHLKKTGPRLKVLSMLSAKNVATSQPDLEGVMNDIDRVTLYRILSAFEEKGIIHKVFDLNGTAN